MTYEKKKIIIDGVLTEYQELRAEIRCCMQLQCTIMSLFVTAIGIVFTLMFKTDNNGIYNTIIQIVGMCLIPGMSAFCGTLWVAQVFRQIRIGSYIYELEEKANKIVKIKSTNTQKKYYPVLYWEHCVDHQNTDISNLKFLMKFKWHLNYINPNFLYYYVGLGFFAVIPFISWLIVCQQAGLIFNIWSILGIIFFICYVIFAAFDVVAIIKIRNYTLNNIFKE